MALTLATLLLSPVLAQTDEELQNPAPTDWPSYGRDLGMQRYSPLDQINNKNVQDLQLAWSRDLGLEGSVQYSPTEYDGIIYNSGPDRVIALDAKTGDQLWEHTVKLNKNTVGLNLTTMRGGVLLYEGKAYCTTGDGRVIALDAKTGKLVWSKQIGIIQLGEGFTSQPIFADGKIVVGPAGADNGGTPGRIVALDAASGDTAWTFYVVPRPGEPGFETWEPASSAQWGGASAWAPGTYDVESNLIIWGTGNANPWYRPGVRAGDNLYTASYVALDASTGKLKWYHQIVPGDEWDYDVHATPTIADLKIDGKEQHVAILPLTMGFVNILDAKTGKFLKAHNIFKEQTGQLNDVIHGFNPDGTSILNEKARMKKPGDVRPWCPARWASFEPGAYSPQTGLYYRPNSLYCLDLVGQPLPDDWEPGQSAVGTTITPKPDTFDRLGGLAAIDLDTGKIVWEDTLQYDSKSGVVATAGDLVFFASPDRTFRAYDAKTGDLLWQQVLPATMNSAPISYEVDGTQYIAVPVGGANQALTAQTKGTPPTVQGSGSLFVYALPQDNSQVSAP